MRSKGIGRIGMRWLCKLVIHSNLCLLRERAPRSRNLYLDGKKLEHHFRGDAQ